MPKMMIHDVEARAALGRGIAKLARAVTGTLGPQGLNVIIDRPIGTPIVSRDGVSVAHEVELECPFENMGAQIAREASGQTNEIAGDGTTTAIAIAASLVDSGLQFLLTGSNAVGLVRGLERAAEAADKILLGQAVPVSGCKDTRAVATLAANDPLIGTLVAEALDRVGPRGNVSIEYGPELKTKLDLAEGQTFGRGYLSHHMVTDVARMEVVLDHPIILMSDLKLQTPAEAKAIEDLADALQRPLLIIADEIAPPILAALLSRRTTGRTLIAAIHPPEYGHWRVAALDDLAIATGGRVISRDLGGQLTAAERADLGSARQVRITADQTSIIAGEGDPAAIEARRQQIQLQREMAPSNVERDKLQERLSRLSGGAALILVGAATPVAQKRQAQLIEDAVSAARAAMVEGVVLGGGIALLQTALELHGLDTDWRDAERPGLALLRGALASPFVCIARNAGLDVDEVLRRAACVPNGHGIDFRTGELVDLFAAGIIDPVLVTRTALRNAVSIASLVLTTQTLIATKTEYADTTAGPARGGGMERIS